MAEGLGFDKRGILIGIAGGSGSGKTLVAQTIFEELGSDQVVILKQDFYYKDLSEIPLSDRQLRNFDHPDAFDMDLLRGQVRSLLEGGSADVPVYDYKTHMRTTETRRVVPHAIVVLEGILVLLDPGLRTWMDIKCFIDTDPTCGCCGASSATSWSAGAAWSRCSTSTSSRCARCTCSSSSPASATPT
jgi:uridine kinase